MADPCRCVGLHLPAMHWDAWARAYRCRACDGVVDADRDDDRAVAAFNKDAAPAHGEDRL